LPKTTNEGRSSEALTGGYFWFPAPRDGQVGWSVLTCHDLGFDDTESHSDMWPSVIERLASAWGREVAPLRNRLTLCCYGLPRGRITQPGGRFLLLHGDDAPITDWSTRVLARFHLGTHSVRLLYDEHERTFRQHRTMVFDEFGLPKLTAHRRVGERRR
jgi:hypothetical protein